MIWHELAVGRRTSKSEPESRRRLLQRALARGRARKPHGSILVILDDTSNGLGQRAAFVTVLPARVSRADSSAHRFERSNELALTTSLRSALPPAMRRSSRYGWRSGRAIWSARRGCRRQRDLGRPVVDAAVQLRDIRICALLSIRNTPTASALQIMSQATASFRASRTRRVVPDCPPPHDPERFKAHLRAHSCRGRHGARCASVTWRLVRCWRPTAAPSGTAASCHSPFARCRGCQP
jgi:hypothetical protein